MSRFPVYFRARSAGVNAIALLVTALSLPGCGGQPRERLPVHPVAGQITLRGRPLANAFVVLHPKGSADPRAITARGQTDRSGRFQATTYVANDGAPAGEYAVTVVFHQLEKQGESFVPGRNILSPKIASPASTDISIRVAEGTNQLKPIDVRR